MKTLAVSHVADTQNAETELIPVSLSANNITHNNAYRRLLEDDLIKHNLNFDPNLDEVNDTATKISKLLLDSIVLFDNHWVLVTEYELYIRNMKSIDDCAQDSFSRMYPSQVEVYEINKYEKGNAWVETVMFWDRFDLLVTGGLRGSYSDNMIVPFLGSAVKALKPTSYDDENKTTIILVKYENTDFIQNTRKLRQYNKAVAMQK
ncbi:MAG: hypothetical protein EXX96DRAFT_523890 [Benjaminiella poitrasii]|nr:MAG: hypothetical protein EXX96DRAFT_523890 [Benjaminiella poitrasii]